MTTLGYLRSVREWAYPTLKSSAFLEKGVLTPEEFVRAGDELVYRCPTWSWEAGDPQRSKSYLPPDKQYLITRNVPCRDRVASMELLLDLRRESGGGDGDGDDDDDDWLVSHVVRQAEIGDDFDILDEEGEVVVEEKPPATTTKEATADGEAGDGGDEYADMEDFEDDNILMDDDAAAAPPSAGAASSGAADAFDDNLVKVRTYDLSITYDKYYQTPRVWMVGKSAEEQQPLSGKQMMEDVITDYANKTVTIENHPHVAGPHASIHPCQHGKVMKTIVRNLIKASTEKAATDDAAVERAAEGPSVEMYLFIFLKFVSSIIPHINYDFTMDVTASTSK